MNDENATPAAGTPDPLSILGQLGQRREAIAEAQVLTLSIPRWDNPELWIQFRPLPFKRLKAAQRLVEKAKKNPDDVELDANLDILIEANIAVGARIDGERYSLRVGEDGRPMGRSAGDDHIKIGPDLARALGMDPDAATARAVARRLYITDGDALSHVKRLTEWSGYAEADADEEVEGES